MVRADVRRGIEQVPLSAIALLYAADGLPALPPSVTALRDQSTGRPATVEELASLTWLLARHVAVPVGVAAYRDVYDWNTARDVRQLVHIAGSPRAIFDLLWYLRANTDLPLLGDVDAANTMIEPFLALIGGKKTRCVWEATSP
ncbi:MAG: hypothetical protein NVS1B2_15750 [Vulcanimicrobiaceae bacterium]